MTPFSVGDTVEDDLTRQRLVITQVDTESDPEQVWYRCGSKIFPHKQLVLIAKGVDSARVERPEEDEKL